MIIFNRDEVVKNKGKVLIPYIEEEDLEFDSYNEIIDIILEILLNKKND